MSCFAKKAKTGNKNYFFRDSLVQCVSVITPCSWEKWHWYSPNGTYVDFLKFKILMGHMIKFCHALNWIIPEMLAEDIPSLAVFEFLTCNPAASINMKSNQIIITKNESRPPDVATKWKPTERKNTARLHVYSPKVKRGIEETLKGSVQKMT